MPVNKTTTGAVKGLVPAHPFWQALRLPRRVWRDVAITTLFINLLSLAVPIFTRVVYDRIVPSFAEATLWVLFSGIVVVLAADVLFKSSRNWITDHLGGSAGARLEQDLLQHVVHLPGGMNMAHTSYTLSCLQDVRTVFCNRLLPALIDVPFIALFLLVIGMMSPIMVLVPMGCGLLLLAVQYAFHGPVTRTLTDNQQALEQKIGVLSEMLAGRETLRQLASTSFYLQRWRAVTTEAGGTLSQLQFWQHLTSTLCQMTFTLNSVLLLVVGVYQVHEGRLSVGGLIAISLLSGRVLAPLAALGELIARAPKIRRDIRMINDLLARPAENTAGGSRITLAGSAALEKASVELGGRRVLDNVSLKLEAGRKLALVGPTGAGKTTLLKALSQEVPLAQGRLLWDDHDAAHLDKPDLRAQMGIIEQHPYFFRGSLRDNLCLGIEFDTSELMVALEIAGLDRFIKEAGQGLELQLAEGGLNLSGGQRQCLAMARMLVRQPVVVLMDEPTAMMDHTMEQRLVHNLRFALKDRMAVIVTHRTPLLSLVDSVAVLEQGTIARHGERDAVLRSLQHAAG